MKFCGKYKHFRKKNSILSRRKKNVSAANSSVTNSTLASIRTSSFKNANNIHTKQT